MADILEYKCPCCGGKIEFDSNIQQMKCPYCDTTFDVAAVKDFEKQKKSTTEETPKWDTYNENSGSGDWKPGETDHIIHYVCTSCAGEIIADENTGATSCPYCGNPVVVSDKFEGILRPDYVIPFKLDKEAAKGALEGYLKGKVLLPKLFKSKNRIDEIKGVYVPFWLFDCDVDAHIRYNATRTSHWSDSSYDYTKTDHYALFRSGSIGFNNVPVDGSQKMDDQFMESIEPFDYSQCVNFETPYLAGYLADKFDVDAQQSAPRANDRIKNSTTSAFGSTTVGYTTCIPDSVNINTKQGKISYALMPVWMLNTSYMGKTYTFAMNGQTGKFIGDLPVDRKKYWGIFAAVCGGISVLGSIIMTFLR